MKTEKPCLIENCPAMVSGRNVTCEIHRHARLAKEIGVSQRSDGKGGARCLSCRRIFKEADWVEKEPTFVRGNKSSTHGYKHVSCEPPTARLSKRKMRESPKPLLDAMQ